jgi:hypothetical protein
MLQSRVYMSQRNVKRMTFCFNNIAFGIVVHEMQLCSEWKT